MNRIGYLLKDTMEVHGFTMYGRLRKVRAVRIVDAQGEDMIQPWPRTKKEALEVAKACDITIVGWLPR